MKEYALPLSIASMFVFECAYYIGLESECHPQKTTIAVRLLTTFESGRLRSSSGRTSESEANCGQRKNCLSW